MLKIINKNILTIEEGIICHQVNCMGVMGAGLAKEIAKKWPKVFQEYKDAYHKDGLRLGNVIFVNINNNLWVANVCGQYGYGKHKNFIYTIYNSVARAFYKINEFAFKQNLQIYVPYFMGCGLAGGNWEVYSTVIEEVAPNTIICRKENI